MHIINARQGGTGMKLVYAWGIVGLALYSGCSAAHYQHAQCKHSIHLRVNNVSVYKDTSNGVLLFESGLMVNADGAPDAYHPSNTGSDHCLLYTSDAADE